MRVPLKTSKKQSSKAMNKQIKLGVIPAAGAGKRTGYLSDILPKCLFPLYDKPIIRHVIDNMTKIGVEEIVIPTHFMKERMFEYFEHARKDIDAEIRLLPLKELPNGIALSIESAKPYVDEPFIVILGDDVTIAGSLQPLVDTFLSSRAIAVEAVVKEEDREAIKRTCSVELKNDGQISRITEKPENPRTDARGCGIYVFDPKVFDYIENTPPTPPRNEVEITNTIGLVARDGKAYGRMLSGININVNTPEDLFRAWCALRTQAVNKK